MECVFLDGVAVFLESSAESPFPPHAPESSNSPFRGASQPRPLFLHVSGQPCYHPEPQFPHLICKMGIIMFPPPRVVVRIYYINVCSAQQDSDGHGAMLLLLLVSHLVSFWFSQHCGVGAIAIPVSNKGDRLRGSSSNC